MKFLSAPLFYLASIAYLFSYSEKPFGFFILTLLLINGHIKSILYSLLIVLLDAVFQYLVHESLFPRFIQNLYTLSILLSLIINKPIDLKEKNINILFYLLMIVAVFRFVDNIDGSPAIYFLNENLIGIAIFSIMLLSRFSLMKFFLLSGLSVKALAIQSIFLNSKPFYFIFAVLLTFLMYIYSFGAVGEYINDFSNGTFSSNRIELWKILFDKYKYFDQYSTLHEMGFSNSESFFFNQIYSYPFIWPLIWALIIRAIICSYDKNIHKAMVLIACALYPYPHFIFFIRLFSFNSKRRLDDA
jgi:hypothetical protein